jgi:hypothetical protein
MPPITNVKNHDRQYFEAHPWQGTFALTFACLSLVALISIGIMMAFGA